jgi:hypothetical protein
MEAGMAFTGQRKRKKASQRESPNFRSCWENGDQTVQLWEGKGGRVQLCCLHRIGT